MNCLPVKYLVTGVSAVLLCLFEKRLSTCLAILVISVLVLSFAEAKMHTNTYTNNVNNIFIKIFCFEKNFYICANDCASFTIQFALILNTHYMDTKKKIVVIGSSNTDMVIKSDRLPKPGETILGGNFLMNHGGKGANQACACALAGGDVTMLGAVGNDSYGTVLEKTLKECNVVPKLKYDDSVSSGCASILIEEEKHDNRIIVVPGANFSVTVDLVKDNISLLEEADIVITQ